MFLFWAVALSSGTGDFATGCCVALLLLIITTGVLAGRCAYCRAEVTEKYINNPRLLDDTEVEREMTDTSQSYRWLYQGRQGQYFDGSTACGHRVKMIRTGL